MNDNANSAPASNGAAPSAITIKIFGVGNAGGAVLNSLMARGLGAAECVAINSDAAALATSSAATKILLESKLLRGLGTGGDPERGRQLAEESLPKVKPALEGASAVFIIAGLGGGAGTGIAPVLAKAARDSGALTLGFVTSPFDCEGSRRRDIAENG